MVNEKCSRPFILTFHLTNTLNVGFFVGEIMSMLGEQLLIEKDNVSGKRSEA